MDLQGTDGANALTGGAGDDVIYGFGGNDTLKGGAGDDVLAGHSGNDLLQGGDGEDYLLGGSGNDTLDGGAGGDWAAYEDATAAVKIDLNNTNAQNTGGGGTDKLVGIEHVYGSAFNDVLIGNADNNMMVGDAGNDSLTGGKGDDTLWGDAGTDTIDGGDGDDYLVGGSGDDTVKGGAGWDWSSYENATAGVAVDLTKSGAAQDTGGAGKDVLSGIEHLYGSNFADVLKGDAQNNYLWGAAGDDKLYGGAGDDHLSGGSGVNTIDGGDGWDTVDYSFSAVGVTINLQNAPAPQVPIPEGVDTIISVEAAMGSAFNDYIVGNAAENYLFGDAGNDVIFGIDGHDVLDGGDGNDILRGSFRKPGDMLLGGAGDDLAIVWTGPGSEGDATIVDGGAGVDTLVFAAVYDLTFDLKVTGDQVVAPGVHFVVQNIENITGGSGNDRLTGDAGANVINGGAGNDILDGGAGFDIASYEGGPAVRVDLSKAGPQYTKGAGADTLINIEGLRGSSLADVLIGDAKDNTLEGSSGDDTLDGGAGVDTATFWGNAASYTWARNANGTWTVRGLMGVDTLLNIETLKFSDKSVTLSPSAATVTVDDLVKPQVIAASSVGDLRDAVLSPDGRTVYVSDKEGYVTALNAATGESLGHWKVGSKLGGMDVSVDGQYLVVAERDVYDATGSGWDAQGSIKAHLVDLRTGAVKDYVTTTSGYALGYSDAVFTADGKVLLSQDFAGSGITAITSLDLATGAIAGGGPATGQSGVFSATDDRQRILLAQRNVSDAPLYVLTSGQGQTAAHDQYADGVTGFNHGVQAIAGNGLLIAQSLGGVLYVYDQALNLRVDLAKLHPELTDVYGMDFSADGKHLFVVDAGSDRIFEYSTSTWKLERAFSLGMDLLPNPSPVYDGMFGDRVLLSNDDGRMIITTPMTVVSVNMTGLNAEGGSDEADVLSGGVAADRLQGFAGDDALNGGGGDDVLIGDAGADILIGGQGKDVLFGGAGADIFKFAALDSVPLDNTSTNLDVITDFESSDKLVFTGGPVTTFYREYTANTFAEAQDVARTGVTSGATAKYVTAVQVGDDTFVFVAGATANSAGVENQILLVGVDLTKVDQGNFLAA